jgi:hypothetical protein
MTTTEKRQVSANTVRTWARNKGLEVGQRGHLSREVVRQFNRSHRRQEFTSSNPSDRAREAANG